MAFNCGDVIENENGINENEMEYNRIWDAFNEMRQQKVLCDAILLSVNGEVFPAHKAILAANSKHFLDTFTTKGDTKNPTTEYITEDIEGEHLEAILDYMYKRVARITMDNALPILKCAENFEIRGLAEQCSSFLCTALNCSNCISIWKFSTTNNKLDLVEKSRKYILENFVSISQKNNDYFHLTSEEVTDFISDNNLNIKTEESVFESVTRWIDFEPATRAKYLATFLENIRLGLIGVEYFVDNISNSKYVLQEETCEPLIRSAWEFLYDLQKNGSEHVSLTDPLVRPRIPRDVLFTIGGWTGGNPISQFETYDTRADRWYTQIELEENTARSYYGMAVVDNKIYLIGGYDGVMYFNSNRRFDPVLQEWLDMAPMYSQRCYVCAVACNGYIYALGGYDGQWRLNSVERYDPTRNQWTMVSHMISKRSDAGADTLAGRIYVAGGFDGEECLSTVEVYTPETDQWTMCRSMSRARSGISVLAHRGLLYCIGGFDGTERHSSGETYDPVTKKWNSMKDMYSSRSNSAIAAIDDMIFVMGGFDGRVTVEHVECYNSDGNEWLDATDMNLNRSAFKACVIRNLPTVRNYTYYGYKDKMDQLQDVVI